jgi:hypothetical protein
MQLHNLLKTQTHPALTQNVRQLLPQLWAIVLSKALQSGLPARGYVDAESDKESGIQTAVLRVYLKANAAQALAFWNGLDPDLEAWMALLNKVNRTIAQRDLVLRIHWK